MGDRTYTAITLNAAFEPFVECLFETRSGSVDQILKDVDGVHIICHEANYGEMDDVENVLEEYFIPYDKRWEAGSEFGPGGKTVRVTRTKTGLTLDMWEYYDDAVAMDARDVMRMLDDGAYGALREAAVAAVRNSSPAAPTINLVPFMKEHEAMLDALRKAASG